MEIKSSILYEGMDSQGPDIAANVVKNSKELNIKTSWGRAVPSSALSLTFC